MNDIRKSLNVKAFNIYISMSYRGNHTITRFSVQSDNSYCYSLFGYPNSRYIYLRKSSYKIMKHVGITHLDDPYQNQ